MDIRFLATALITLYLPIHAQPASALTMEQFSGICASTPKECSEHPFIQAYIGGALDLLATLDETTKYLEKVYCEEPKTVFDVSKIIQFMETKSEQYAADNAMLALLDYFKEHGGCQS